MEIETRLEELRSEYHQGERQLIAMERQQRELRDTMLRISGAIQVLEELLAERQTAANGANGTTEATAV